MTSPTRTSEIVIDAAPGAEKVMLMGTREAGSAGRAARQMPSAPVVDVNGPNPFDGARVVVTTAPAELKPHRLLVSTPL